MAFCNELGVVLGAGLVTFRGLVAGTRRSDLRFRDMTAATA